MIRAQYVPFWLSTGVWSFFRLGRSRCLRVCFLIVPDSLIQRGHGGFVLTFDEFDGVFHITCIPDIDQLQLNDCVFTNLKPVFRSKQLFSANFPGTCNSDHTEVLILIFIFHMLSVYVVQIVFGIAEFHVHRAAVDDHIRDISVMFRIDHQSPALLFIAGGSDGRDLRAELFLLAEEILPSFLCRGTAYRGGQDHHCRKDHREHFLHACFPPL